jgi:tetratricopeptide (TPR) repeat protein
MLAVVGIAVRHAWISAMPLAAGDWAWRDRPRLSSFFPWPSLWDPSLGLGGTSRFLAAFRFPVYALSGLLARLGANWTVIESVLYFIPFAVLLPVGGWLLAREVMGRTRWALLTPLLLLGNTYFLVESNGEIPLTLAASVGMLALVGFLRAMRRRSLGWAILTGLLLGVACAVDIRPAYLCLILMAMYFVILTLVSLEWHLFWRRALLGIVTVGTFVGTQAFWLVPLFTYHGNTGFPIPPTPDFPILTISHGLSGVIAFWTGGLPSINVQAPLNPMFMILPIVALAPLLRRRLTPEVLWLSLAALCFAFFVNTDNPPFGSVYDWMYAHIPGWNLFREGSKFLFVVGVAYALLIPIALKSAFEWVASRQRGFRVSLGRGTATAALLSVIAISCYSTAVLETGRLDSTTIPTSEPASLSTLSATLARDQRPGNVLWFGRPVTTEGLRHHTFVVASPVHPAVNLTGRYNPANDVVDRDPFQLYCGDTLIPYCYVDPQLFPYLARMTGAGYVVVPRGSAIGLIPHGVTRAWLGQQMTAMFGQPSVFGSGSTSLLVWRLSSPAVAVTTAPAVAVVEGGTWAASQVLPALRAMDIPVAYRQSYDRSHYPASPAGLPAHVDVLPRTDGSCVGTAAESVGVMVQSTSPSAALTVAGSTTTLSLLAAPSRLPGWGVYGPVTIAAGAVPITGSTADAIVGPCIAWSPLASVALGRHASEISGVVVGSDGERITASSSGGGARWVQLNRFHDAGWQLAGKPAASTGGGLFNLYELDAARAGASQLTFSYSTIPWERIGLAGSISVVVIALAVAWRDLRRRVTLARANEEAATHAHLEASVAGRWVASIGMAMLVASALAVTADWFGLPSRLPGITLASNPYGLDVGYGVAAIGLLLLSLAVRVIAHLQRALQPDTRPRASGLSARVVGSTSVITLIALLASCGPSPGDLQSLLGHGQQGGPASANTQASLLEEARLARATHEALLCIADYTRALALFPNLVNAYSGRAACYLAGGRNSAAAVEDYTAALMLSPANGTLLLRRAVADRGSGNIPAAVADYEQAATIPGSVPEQQLLAIDGLLSLDEFSAAVSVYRVASQRDGTSPIIQLAAADIALATGASAAADGAFASAVRLASKKVAAAEVLSRLCHHEVLEHLYREAAVDCADAAQTSRHASGAFDDLSAAQLALGDPTSALVDINAAIGAFIGGIGRFAQPAGVDGLGLARLYAARGWIDVQLHSISAAVLDFEQALQALPTPEPDVRARLKAAIATAEAD